MFTARYGLIPYVKQFKFRPEKVNAAYSTSRLIIKQHKSGLIKIDAEGRGVISIHIIVIYVVSLFRRNLHSAD